MIPDRLKAVIFITAGQRPAERVMQEDRCPKGRPSSRASRSAFQAVGTGFGATSASPFGLSCCHNLIFWFSYL
jgi:hypothetical protein